MQPALDFRLKAEATRTMMPPSLWRKGGRRSPDVTDV